MSSELEGQDANGRRLAPEQGTDYALSPIGAHFGPHDRQTAQLLDGSAADAGRDSADPDDLAARRVLDALDPFSDPAATRQDWTLTRGGS